MAISKSVTRPSPRVVERGRNVQWSQDSDRHNENWHVLRAASHHLLHTCTTAGLFGWSALTLHLALNPKPEASTPVAVMGLAWTFYGLFAGGARACTV